MRIVNNLEQSIYDIQSFFKENGIRFLPARKKGNRLLRKIFHIVPLWRGIKGEEGIKTHFPKKSNKYYIDFTLNVKSYVSETLIADEFHFELEFKRVSKNLRFTIYTKIGSAIPFHPHFQIFHKPSLSTIITKQAKWIDYLNEQGDIVSFVKRVILSLQWNKGYINIDANKIGNKDAEQWFLKEDYRKTDKFPTDIFLKNPIKINSESISEAKKVSLQPKKFTIDDDQSKKKKFKINDEIIYNIETKSISDFKFEIDKKLNSIANTISKTQLFISAKAKKQIWEHIKWGNLQTPSNRNEQGGILLGQVYFDNSNQVQFGIVEQVIYSESARGNSVYLEMNHETWSQMLNDADEIIDNSQNSNIQVIGWYHTHPNNLDVFMSGTDMNTQQHFFNQSWHYAIVLNPHKQIWKAFYGAEAKVCQGFMVKDSESNNFTEKVIESDKEEKSILKKKDIIILLLMIALISTIAFILFQNSERVIDKQPKLKEEKITNKPTNQEILFFSSSGDTIAFSKNSEFKSSFDSQLFVKKTDVIYNSDSTTIGFLSKIFIKDSAYSEFGTLKDTLKISSKEIQVNNSEWISFNFKGLIKSKDE